ncbi:MAG: ribosome small subunit-dependent GTPase A [Bacteroidales bacterium]|nr:ribosome small subunit-dependent GTPase A [Bacteroidales bacterium]
MELTGIVIKSTGSWYIIRTDDGVIYNCKLKGKFKIKDLSSTNPVVVGDKVIFELVSNDFTGLISKILPRTNYIIRKSKNLSKLSQVIAANVDNMLIICTLKLPETSQGFIDRLLFAAEAYHIKPTIVFNKIDLYEPELIEKLERIKTMYFRAGYPSLCISAFRGDNIENLKTLMSGKTNLLTGHSGVGKSAILNTLQPELNVKTNEISAMHLKGKHTTTFAEMHTLDFGAYIIDTPGIKEFSLIDFQKDEIAGYFPDIFPYEQGCRFKNCLHINEPGCAVKKAVEQENIHPSRYKSYLSIMQSDETDIKFDD